jgi:DNA-binding MarR family transcriptional regulator
MPPLTFLLPLKRHAEANGLTLNHLAVLVTVERKTRTHTEIAELLGNSTAAVTGLIDRLAAAQCLSSTTSPGDRRCKIVDLTPRGRHILDTAPLAA